MLLFSVLQPAVQLGVHDLPSVPAADRRVPVHQTFRDGLRIAEEKDAQAHDHHHTHVHRMSLAKGETVMSVVNELMKQTQLIKVGSRVGCREAFIWPTVCNTQV